MIGGIVVDFISFRYEWNNHKPKESTEKKEKTGNRDEME